MILQKILARCALDQDTGCLNWRGALSDGKFPRVSAPNLAKPGQPAEVQTGARAVWQLHTGKPIPDGHRVYRVCTSQQCLNVKHLRCGPTAQWGAHTRKTGRQKDVSARIIANRAIGRTRSKLTPELIQQIQLSPETGQALAKRLDLNRSLVSKARRGKTVCWQGQANPFAGLMLGGPA